jgi:transposase
MYLVRRRKGDTKAVLVVADYVVTADSLRTAVDTYGRPQVIAKSNPNGSITDEAFQVAGSLGVPLVEWSGLFKELRKP